LLIVSCDDPPPRPPAVVQPPAAELRTVLSLRANQQTLLAAGSGGRVFFSQPNANAAVQSLGNDGKVRPTALTAENVAQRLGKPAGDGRVQAFATLDNGDLLAYFQGIARRESLACLVLYQPSSDNLRVLATPEELATASKLGSAIDLAEVQMVRAGQSIWLWLRTFDQSIFLQIDTRQLSGDSLRLARPFTQLKTDGQPFRFARDDTLFGQLDGTLHLLRRSSGELWSIGRDGVALPIAPVPDTPQRSVPPLLVRDDATEQRKRWLHFFPFDNFSLDTGVPGVLGNEVRYPALRLEFDGQQHHLDRDALQTRPAFPLHALRLTNWIVEPATNDVIAYDAMSGEIFRIIFSHI
ncbi:MAG TPA: hypothetical protein VGB55_03865, partial [Tepidisphaeraceae bacterium]